MSFCRYRWCKSEKVDRTIWMRNENPSAILSSEVTQLSKWEKLSTRSINWPLIDEFGVTFTQTCSIILHFGGAKRIPNIAADLSKLQNKSNQLQGSSISRTTLSAPSRKSSIPEWGDSETAVSSSESMTKLKRKGGNRKILANTTFRGELRW